MLSVFGVVIGDTWTDFVSPSMQFRKRSGRFVTPLQNTLTGLM
jgi:hypothetical protein